MSIETKYLNSLKDHFIYNSEIYKTSVKRISELCDGMINIIISESLKDITKEEIKFNVKKVKDTKKTKTKKEEPKANDINIDIPKPQTEEDIENEKYLESIVDEYLGEFVTVVDGKISVKDTVMIAEKLVEEISFLKESMRHLIESMDNDEEIVYPKKDKKNKEKKNKKDKKKKDKKKKKKNSK